MEKREFISRGPSETWEIGEIIAKELTIGSLVLITGDMGSGKTQLIKGIAKGLGFKDWIYVNSPSFTIVNVYEGGRQTLIHVDFYRLSNEEASDIFVEEMLDEGIVVVEWPERRAWHGPRTEVKIEIIGENERRIEVVNLGTI
ncbi:MAG: tRNA (adenosine(37)-N6)-threonylcarbamoyltransferase complex ATPase subunit type 1 TsaE [Desulfobacterota bacterium]|nr:tRNA (adenosine(37)-N6)-threonylcarbamoyltransferase complex ATPase subunit type 1 TsaE [Thermodesulfobacteriota bacterium]MDW8002259.1 tRNA (adenosine(37)-N6)-threonylcarbamoyltransferase complex ATPase subunit type 1 TsaE [Deltaproteobacteria bacterium]